MSQTDGTLGTWSRSPVLDLALLRERRREILRLAAEHGVRSVRVFGSVARGEAGPGSDVDFLVAMERDRSLLDLIGFRQDVEDLLGRKVDVVSEPALHWYIREEVLRQAVPL
ncbi:MAG TPA: nucleotidyltransferase family protein [Longimicrobiaceae bacterium]|jgi:predicted nucleotidyltransferase|nr:nucleotidyltransferase family protein [Longimicrobiaceae bacterium]